MSTRVRVAQVVAPGATVAVDSETAHHLLHVLRLGVGAALVVVDDSGAAFHAHVATLGTLGLGGATSLAVGQRVEGAQDANPRHRVSVWLPLLKGGKTDDLIRQLTEVGVSQVVPWRGSRSVVKLDAAKALKRRERWQKISDEATRQCRRTDRVDILAVSRTLPTAGRGIFLHESGGKPLEAAIASQALDAGVCADEGYFGLLVGPEGGLAGNEVAGLTAAGWSEVWLGSRILRAETAVIAGAVMLLQSLGEYQPRP